LPKKIIPPTYDSEILKQDIRWGEFRAGDLFDFIKRGRRIKSFDRIPGNLPFITAGIAKRGFSSFIGNLESEIFPANSLTIDMFGTVFYRNHEYGADDHIAVLYNNSMRYSKETLLFLGVCIEKAISGKFSYSRNFYASDAHDIIVLLPKTTEGLLNFAYMKSYIAKIEAEYITKLETHLTLSGLIDYELTDADKQVLKCEPRWGDFSLLDILDWQSQVEINPLHLEKLKISNEERYPFYGQSTTNNGVIMHCELKEDVLNNKMGKPTILIHSNNQNVVYLETPFYLKDGHGATSVLQASFLNKYNALFIMSSIKKVILDRFSYNAKATKIGLKNTRIKLPIYDNGALDLAYMEAYVKAQQKFIIASVVQRLSV